MRFPEGILPCQIGLNYQKKLHLRDEMVDGLPQERCLRFYKSAPGNHPRSRENSSTIAPPLLPPDSSKRTFGRFTGLFLPRGQGRGSGCLLRSR